MEAKNVTVVAAHKRHKKHEYTLCNIPDNIPVEQTEHRLEGEGLVCAECGNTMTEIGKEVVRTLEIIPAQTIVHEDIYYTYACKRCSESAGKAYSRRHVRIGKYQNSSTEVCSGQSVYLSERTMTLPDQLSERRQTGDL